jgi:hydrogenase expression/formation protein HypC
MAFVPEAGEGDYVLVHAGVAISCIDAEEAAKVFETLHELALVEEEMDAAGGPPGSNHQGSAES